MARPRRPQSHVTGEQGVQLFRQACPPEWVVHVIHEDYGLDLLVEIVTDGDVTGEEFYVQVKGTAASDAGTDGPVRVRVKRAVVDYWRTKVNPVLLVRVNCTSGVMHYGWANNVYAGYEDLGGRATEANPANRDPSHVVHALGRNSRDHQLVADITEGCSRHFACVQNALYDLLSHRSLSRLALHVSALHRVCVDLAIRLPSTSPSELTQDELDRMKDWFNHCFLEFGLHNMFLMSLSDAYFTPENALVDDRKPSMPPGLDSQRRDTDERSRRDWAAGVMHLLAEYGTLRDTFFIWPRRQLVGGLWLVPYNRENLGRNLLPTLGKLGELEEVLLRLMAIGSTGSADGEEPEPA